MTTLERIPNLEYDPQALAEFCQMYGIRKLALFGSVLRDDFTPESDVDVWFIQTSDKPLSWRYMDEAQTALSEIFGGRAVDFIPRKSIDSDPNYLRRYEILSSSKVVYAEG